MGSEGTLGFVASAVFRTVEVPRHTATDRTCEIGMKRATGRPYRHVLELLDDATS